MMDDFYQQGNENKGGVFSKKGKTLDSSGPEADNRKYGERLDPDEEKPSQSQILIQLVSDCELFHDKNEDAFITIPRKNFQETVRIKSSKFKSFIIERFYSEFCKAPGSQPVVEALSTLEAKALFRGQKYPVYVRLAGLNGNIYLDLCDDIGRIIEIRSDGFEVITNPPVKFHRPSGIQSLPIPEPGGSLDDLRPFCNIHEEGDWKLFCAFLIQALNPDGPFPALSLQGAQGSSKSTISRIIKLLIDPASAPLRITPDSKRDLMISAENGWVLVFDNLSIIPGWFSDALCRLSTGGGFSTRGLYKDREEIIFNSKRPTVLNGIEEIIRRPDLMDRTIAISTPHIPENNRMDEKTFWELFEAVRPKVLGALLKAVCGAMQKLPEVKLKKSPRMSDFARFGTAAEFSLGWVEGSFLEAYNENRSISVEQIIECEPIAQALLELDGESWEGTHAELKLKLEALVSDTTMKSKDWPKSARGFSGKLWRLAPALRQRGLEIERTGREGGTGRRLVSIKRMGHPPSQPSQPSQTLSVKALPEGDCDDMTMCDGVSGNHSRVGVGKDKYDGMCHLSEAERNEIARRVMIDHGETDD